MGSVYHDVADADVFVIPGEHVAPMALVFVEFVDFLPCDESVCGVVLAGSAVFAIGRTPVVGHCFA